MNLADWLDRDAIAARLTARGMSADCAANAAPCFEQAAKSLQNKGRIDRAAAVVSCWAPGRIEVLGKHTDYCGGESILAAVERGFCFLAVPREDAIVHVIDTRRVDTCQFPLSETPQSRLGHWSNYPQTVIRRLARNFPHARRGATIAFASNLPASSGMSSSSAFVVGTFLLLSRINDLECDPAYAGTIRTSEDLAGYLGTVENGASFGPLAGDRGVGTFGGSEDHTAILCGRPEQLVQYAYCPVRFRRTIQLSDDYVFAIASSGVIADKAGAALEKYNRISAMVRTIVSTWQTATGRNDPSLAAILESAPDAAGNLRHVLAMPTDAAFTTDELIERLDHFATESRLIRAVPDAINAATIGAFGELAYESYRLADRHLKNQTPETNRLVEIAQQLGAPAASAFGAGFGGSVWAVVDQLQASDLLDAWRSEYQNDHPGLAQASEFLLTRPGVSSITLD